MRKNSILEKQTTFIKNKLKQEVESKSSLVDFYRAISKSLNDFIDMAFKPSFQGRESLKFDKAEQQGELEHIILDLNIINDSVSNINDVLTANFNDMQIFQSRCKNLLNKTKSSLQSLNFLTNNNEYVMFGDSFHDYSKIDQDLTVLSEASIMTTEGILTLPVTEETKQEGNVQTITYSSPNGAIGNYGIVDKAYNGNAYYFLSSLNARDRLRDLVDQEPNTWVEFQGNDSTLDVSISFKFSFDVLLNWISLDPYIPAHSHYTFKVKSIQYRDQNTVSFKEVNIDHQDKYISAMIADSDANKFENIGVYLFEPIKANEVVIKLSTDKEFLECFGKYEYNLYNSEILIEKDIGEERAKELVSNILSSDIEGFYNISSSAQNKGDGRYIEKRLIIGENYRKAIGLRDVKLRLLYFQEKSEIFSTLFSTNSNITEVRLSTVESINGLQAYGKHISYFISFDDNEWLPIRPSNQLFGNLDAPIAYHINSTEPIDVQGLNQNIGYINGKYQQIRLKIVLQSQVEGVSPVLEQYALFCKTAESEGIQ